MPCVLNVPHRLACLNTCSSSGVGFLGGCGTLTKWGKVGRGYSWGNQAFRGIVSPVSCLISVLKCPAGRSVSRLSLSQVRGPPSYLVCCCRLYPKTMSQRSQNKYFCLNLLVVVRGWATVRSKNN